MKEFLNTVGYYMESYRRDMKFIKSSEQLTPKEYGMMIQEKKKRKKKRK